MDNSSTMGVAGRTAAARRTSTLAAVAVTALVLLLLSLRGLTGLGGPAAPTVPLKLQAATSSSHVAVQISNYAFSPSSLTVTAGTTVTWTNQDTAPHTVTVSSGPVTFSSPQLQKGESFSYTFTKLGTYKYYCAVHPDMTASLTVVAAPAAAPTPAPAPAPAAANPPTSSHTTATHTPAKHHKKKAKQHKTTPAAPAVVPMAAPAAAPASDPMPMDTSTCAGATSALNMFLAHVYAGHLGESPSQQAADITNVDQYVKTHTVLVSGMLGSLVGGSESALNMFLAHVYAGHLGESPSQQVGDITNANQYVLTHTVLVSNLLQAVLGSC